jgi:hypothetical protein
MWRNIFRLEASNGVMANLTDHDGKSKTASAVDGAHYPEQNEVDRSGFDGESLPMREHIAARAFELWLDRGCPTGSPEVDWEQAEDELRAAAISRNAIHSSAGKAGSVQP